MDKEYDIVVVGAGPAGSTVAREAAKKGCRVLLIEKRREIGVPKRCGEGLTMSAIKKGDIKVDNSWVCQETRGARVFAPNGKYVEVDYKRTEGYVIDRKKFDKWLALKAADAGARVEVGTRAVSLLKKGDIISGV